MKIPELLSPVGSMEHLKIAVLSGASSVYLSGKEYGARKYADNFTLEDINEAVEYAHLHNVNVYITVNTLIKENELFDCLEYVFKLYQLGVDGVLIQDIGLLKLINEYIPKFSIHASTQMNIENTDDLKWAKNNGINRVVLPRELTLDELKEITKEAHKLGIEVEIFVHGAQCYCYSGRCLFSSFIGGRSGNRGTCAQPCRKPYDIIVDNKKGNSYKFNNKGKNYFLSPADLSLYHKLDILSEIGVDCLKIEGRMRNKEYVMLTTSTYRQALNKLRNKKKLHEFTSKSGEENLNLAFNRKLSTGHLFQNNNTNRIMNTNKPGHVGLYIGKVEEYEKNTGKISIKLDENLLNIPQKGDGLVIEGKPVKNDSKINTYGFDISGDPSFKKSKTYWNKNRLIKEKVTGKVLVVRKVRENKKEQIIIKPGCKVFLSKRNRLNKDLKELERDSNEQGFRKSTLHMKFYVDNANYPIIKGTVKLSNDKLIKVTQKGLEPWEEAINKPITEETIKSQISKIKDLPYYLETVEVKNINKNLFTPISGLNQLRREFFEKLEKEIINSYKPYENDIKIVERKLKEYDESLKPSNSEFKEKTCNLSVYVNNLENLKKLNANLFTRVYFDIPTKNWRLTDESEDLDISYCVNTIKEALDISKNNDYDLIWMWPNIIHENLLADLIKVCGILSKLTYLPSIMTSHMGICEFLSEKFSIETYGSYPLNITNTESVKEINDFKLLTISPELGRRNYKDIFQNFTEDYPILEVLVHGNIESLVSRKSILPSKMSKEIKKIDNPNNPVCDVYLSDNDNNKYPLHRPLSEDGVVMINYEDLSLIKEIGFLKTVGVSNFSIDARWKSLDYINNVGEVYKFAINNDEIPKECFDTLKEYSPEFSSGNFKKGLE